MNTETEDPENDSSSNVDDSDNDEEMQSSNDGMQSSDEADNESDDNMSADPDENEGNAGWADAFAKILQQEKPKNKKYLVLSKATKLADRKLKTDPDKKLTFEIAGEEDEEKDIKPEIDTEDQKPSNNELELARIERTERNNKLQELRVKPGAMDRERERSFKRIATKGVVQLFNAVRSQQRDLVTRLEKAGPLDHKRDEVLNNIDKKQFLDMLMGGKRAKSENIDNPVKDEKNANTADESRPSQWSVLRDDFMTSKKLKHWDKEDDDDDDDDDNDGQAHDDNDNNMDSDSD